jgi:hypothetical protein
VGVSYGVLIGKQCRGVTGSQPVTPQEIKLARHTRALFCIQIRPSQTLADSEKSLSDPTVLV